MDELVEGMAVAILRIDPMLVKLYLIRRKNDDIDSSVIFQSDLSRKKRFTCKERKTHVLSQNTGRRFDRKRLCTVRTREKKNDSFAIV